MAPKYNVLCMYIHVLCMHVRVRTRARGHTAHAHAFWHMAGIIRMRVCTSELYQEASWIKEDCVHIAMNLFRSKHIKPTAESIMTLSVINGHVGKHLWNNFHLPIVITDMIWW